MNPNSTHLLDPLYLPLTLRAYKKGLQGVKVSDAGGIRWADLSWGA